MALGSEKADKILVVGGTGKVGRHIALASAELGHPTFALDRPSSLSDPAKAPVRRGLEEAGVTVLPGDLDDHGSLIQALKQVDVVISVVGGGAGVKGMVDITKQQLKLIEAAKEVRNIKRFLPSEFADDFARTTALPPREPVVRARLEIREAVKESGLPYTFVVGNTFQGFFVAGLSQDGLTAPPKDKAVIYGHAKAYFVGEEDVASYTVRAAVDPRAENKVLYIRPESNKLSHLELVELWEKKSGFHLDKTQLEEEDVLNRVKESSYPADISTAFLHSLFIKGDQTSFEVPADAVEATQLYPELQYITVNKYLDRFL